MSLSLFWLPFETFFPYLSLPSLSFLLLVSSSSRCVPRLVQVAVLCLASASPIKLRTWSERHRVQRPKSPSVSFFSPSFSLLLFRVIACELRLRHRLPAAPSSRVCLVSRVDSPFELQVQ